MTIGISGQHRRALEGPGQKMRAPSSQKKPKTLDPRNGDPSRVAKAIFHAARVAAEQARRK